MKYCIFLKRVVSARYFSQHLVSQLKLYQDYSKCSVTVEYLCMYLCKSIFSKKMLCFFEQQNSRVKFHYDIPPDQCGVVGIETHKDYLALMLRTTELYHNKQRKKQ